MYESGEVCCVCSWRPGQGYHSGGGVIPMKMKNAGKQRYPVHSRFGASVTCKSFLSLCLMTRWLDALCDHNRRLFSVHRDGQNVNSQVFQVTRGCICYNGQATWCHVFEDVAVSAGREWCSPMMAWEVAFSEWDHPVHSRLGCIVTCVPFLSLV